MSWNLFTRHISYVRCHRLLCSLVTDSIGYRLIFSVNAGGETKQRGSFLMKGQMASFAPTPVFKPKRGHYFGLAAGCFLWALLVFGVSHLFAT